MSIDELISESGYKRQFIAKKLGISRPTLIGRLNHESFFKPDEFRELSNILRIPEEDLIILYENEIKKDEI